MKKEPVGLDDAVCLWLSGNGDRPVASDCCVDETARDAFHRDYHFFIVRGGCAAYEADLHERALCALEKDCAPLVDTAEVLGAWAWETETI